MKIASSNLAVHTLYRIISKDFFTDIFTLDNLEGLRTGIKLQDFDFIFFTIDFEPNYINVIKILQNTGIEPLASKRKRPVLIAGGAAVSSNPYILRPYFDLLCIGEAESILPEIISNLANFDINYYDEKDWAITPQKRTGKRVFLKDLTFSEAASAFYYPKSTFKMNLIEVARSCPSRCRFCLLSYNYLPPRWLPVSRFEELIRIFPEKSTLGLVGGSVLEHPEIEEIIKRAEKFNTINPSSIKISLDLERVLKLLREKGLESITIAPETGSDTLRKKLNKKITNEQILSFVKLVNDLKFKTLKLYFILGLPGEQYEDIEAIVNLLTDISKKFKGKIETTFSIFVPKPHTPFQYEPFISKEEFLKKVKILRLPKGIKADFGSHSGALKQLLFSRGDEDLGLKIPEILRGKKLESIIDIDRILNDTNYVRSLPFNLIDSGVRPGFLETELKKAKKGLYAHACKPNVCNLCGICKQVT